MAQLRVQNRDNKVIKAGEYVKFAPNTRTGIVLTLIGDSNIIGTAAETLFPERWGNVNLLNTVDWSEVLNAPDLNTELYYTKEELQTPGSAIVDYQNLVNVPINVTALFLDDSASDISSYHKLLISPSSISQVEDSAQSNNGNEVLIEAYAMDNAFGSLLLSGGAWHFVIFGKVDSIVGTSTIVARVYKRTSGGVETELFNVSTPALTTSIAEHSIESVQPDFIVGETDRLVIKFFAKSTSVPLRTVYLYHNGIVNYSHVHTTFSITSGPGSSLSLGETESTAYRGDRGKIAYDHSQDSSIHLSASQIMSRISLGF